MRLSTYDSAAAVNLAYWSLHNIVLTGAVLRSGIPPEAQYYAFNPVLDMNSCCPRSSPVEACMDRLTVAYWQTPYYAWNKLRERFYRRRAGSELTAHAKLASGITFWLTTVFSDGILSRRTFDFVTASIGDDS